MVCDGDVRRDGEGGSLGGGVMVTTVFIFGYEKSDSGEPLFCLEYVFRLLETINPVVTYEFVVFTQYPTFCF